MSCFETDVCADDCDDDLDGVLDAAPRLDRGRRFRAARTVLRRGACSVLGASSGAGVSAGIGFAALANVAVVVTASGPVLGHGSRLLTFAPVSVVVGTITALLTTTILVGLAVTGDRPPARNHRDMSDCDLDCCCDDVDCAVDCGAHPMVSGLGPHMTAAPSVVSLVFADRPNNRSRTLSRPPRVSYSRGPGRPVRRRFADIDED